MRNKTQSIEAGSARLTRDHRISKKSDFARLKKGANRLVARQIVVYFQKNHINNGRLAISVSRAYGNSVRRNRFKRIVRDFFRKNKASFIGLDVNIVAKIYRSKGPKVLNSSEQITKDLKFIAQKIILQSEKK